MYFVRFLKKNRFYFCGIVMATVGLFTFQNCTPTFFTLDYQSRVDSLDLASLAPPVWMNNGKHTNQQTVLVQLNLDSLENGVLEKAIKFRYSFDPSTITTKSWEDIKLSFTADMESQFANDGSKDGVKTLIVELQMSRNSNVVRIEGSVILDTIAPQIILFELSHGEKVTTRNFNQAQLKIIDSKTPVNRICLSPKAEAPKSDDQCWLSVNSLGVEPNLEIELSSIPYIIGFLRGTYTVYAFVQDAAGNISPVSLTKTIAYHPPVAPIVTDVFVANNDEMKIPPLLSEMKISGTTAFIRWKIITTTSLINQPVRIYLTSNEKDYSVVASDLNNGSNGGCMVQGTSTGCATLNYPFPKGYFRLRVAVKDQNGQIAVGSSTPLNTEGFQVLAGNTDPGLEGSATAAMFFNLLTTNSYESDPQSLVFTDKGQIIFRDHQRGLLIVEPNDGMIRTLLPLGDVFNEGPISEAKLNFNRAHIALGSAGQILIADLHGIRSLDLEKREITTVLGGGESLADGVKANEFKYYPCTAGCPLYPLPNGDIYFTTHSDFRISFNNGARIRKYSSADKKVHSIKPFGAGTLQDPSLDVADSRYGFDNFVIGFDPATSKVNFLQIVLAMPVVGGSDFKHSTLDPMNFNPVPPSEQAPAAFSYMYNSDQYLSDRYGNAYSLSRIEAMIKKFNPKEKKWETLLGTATQGACVDGVAANQCEIDPQTVFVGLQGYLFFSDRGRIRVLNENTPYTIAGQAFNFGDDGYAVSARFGAVEYIDIDQQGRIKVLDPIENRIREFKRRLEIKSIAGNGVYATQSSGKTAANSPMYASYWGGSTSFVSDPASGDIYIASGNFISKLDRSTGLWLTVAGGGSVPNTNGHGKKGSELNFQYQPLLTGYSSGRIIAATNQWKEGSTYGCLVSKFDTNQDFTQSILIGNSQICTDNYPESGTLQNKISVNDTFRNNHLMAEFIADEQIWLGGPTYRNRIMAFKENQEEIIMQRVSLPRNIVSFARTKNTKNQEIYYYCGHETARIYKFNASTKIETALPWPSSTIDCVGFKIVFDPKTKSILFPFRQNLLSGVAEIENEP